MPNFLYAAHSYLNEWMYRDRGFHEVLAFDKWHETDAAKGRKCLVEMATYYGVIRTLKVTGEELRLQAAYDKVSEIQPPTVTDAAAKVEDLARALESVYGKTPWSAASKFLWMRFRSPIVIYDSIASRWLCKHGTYSDDSYENYCKAWLSKYCELEDQIREACAEIVAIKKFTLAYETPDSELSEWTSSRWFMERVFDHYMLNYDVLKTPVGLP